MVEDIVIPIVFFATTFGIFYLWIITRHKERMALIEKGADASILLHKKGNHHSGRNTVLGVGMFLLGISLGILAGGLLADYSFLPEGVSYSSMVIFFGGLSLVIFYFIDRKNRTTDKREN